MTPARLAIARQADKKQLAELRQYQQRVRLGDEVATDIVKEAARARLEAGLDAALEVIKRRTRARDYSEAITEVRRATGHSPAFRSMSCDAAAAS